VIKAHEGIVLPQASAQFFAGDNLARIFEKYSENLKRLFGELQPETVLAKLASL
jgi:hypothetical protein